MQQGSDPAARLQVVIHTIHVVNDRDGRFTGDGDLTLTAEVWRCSGLTGPCAAGGNAAQMAKFSQDFDLGSGKTKNMERIIPLAADVKENRTTSEEGGLVVVAGQRYLFQIDVVENDFADGDDYMGGVQKVMEQANNWAIGLYESEPAGHFADTSLPDDKGICAGCSGIIDGDYLVTYEIRTMPLPDLRPTGIRVAGHDAQSDQDTVCLGVVNEGLLDAGAFDMSLFVDRSLPVGGATSVAGLAAGATYEGCVATYLPKTGTHEMELIIDIYRMVPESNENNNDLAKPLARTAAPAGPATAGNGGPVTNAPPSTADGAAETADAGETKTPGTKTTVPGPKTTASPTPGQADLTVSTLKVNGQVPDGKDDCKAGKNGVTVTVKNAGAARAEGFAVRLTVDGAEAGEQTVNGLDAGKEREVRFGEVQLKKGEHQITASADAKETVSEADEENNEAKVSPRCKDDD
jgi:hypothetical protein